MSHRRLSPSSLNQFLGCEHRTYLDLLHERGALEAEPLRGDAQLLLDRGQRHEEAFLEHLRSDGLDVVSLPPTGTADTRAQATLDAMTAGRGVVHQACLSDDGWVGYADFLVRLDEPSALGDWSYEVYDAKLGLKPQPRHIFQLLFYNERLAHVQGRAPSQVHLVLGDNQTSSFPPEEFAAYARRVRDRFLLRRDELGADEPDVAYPYPVDDCEFCPWWLHCRDRRRADDHLSLTANLQRRQGLKLEREGICTVAGVATVADDVKVPRLATATLSNLRAQAKLQVHSRGLDAPLYELLEPAHDRGLARLPEPSPGDIFFDFEGDPWWGEDGLQYLFGTLARDDDAWIYEPLWATSRADEKQQFEGWMDWIMARLEASPELHIFHYNSYEPTAIKALMTRHATKAPEVDDLLRRKVFVDLLTVVRQGVRIGTESYGLKAIEPAFGYVRQARLRGAPGSLRRWQQYQESGDPDLLREIAEYNEDDCRSTHLLRDWLWERRPEAETKFAVVLSTLLPEPGREPSDKQLAYRSRVEDARAWLTPDLPDDESDDNIYQRARRVAFDLVGYHEREAKPEYWEFFARAESSADELCTDDAEAIGNLTAIPGTEREDVAKSWRWQLSFPEQDYKLKEGSVWDPDTDGSATIEALDPAARTLVVRRSKSRGDDAPTRLIPGMPIATDAQVDALLRLAQRIGRHGLDPCGAFDAATDILLNRPPRFVSGTPPLLSGDVDHERLCTQVAGLDRSALVIQGPPGTGKTYTGAELAVRLMRDHGLRVGVMATSHKAIVNFLENVDRRAAEHDFSFRGWKKVHADADNNHSSATIVSSTNPPKDEVPQLVAATAWWWARADEFEKVDVLFVDEAGQVSLADAIAVSQGAKNVVLLGDPQQLAHVSKGAHLHGSGVSVLEHLLADAQTVAADRGVFLDRSWRMHSDVCRFVSDTMYGGRLGSIESCDLQTVASSGLAGTGLRLLTVAHDENRQKSNEEAAVIADELRRLLDGGWYTDRHGVTRTLTLADILVVAPYNAQVRTLKATLPADARVGTVDKFQGQEAPVVFYSMTSSSGEELPRGMDFLFSRNRLNVAVSRAQALAVVICAPQLMSTRCSTVEQMKLVNMLCRFGDAAR
jgi:predicted RecB family nuclease